MSFITEQNLLKLEEAFLKSAKVIEDHQARIVKLEEQTNMLIKKYLQHEILSQEEADEFYNKMMEGSNGLEDYPGDFDGSRGYGSSGDRDTLVQGEPAPAEHRVFPNPYGDTFPKQYEMPGQHADEVPCTDHPNAPHGFNRNASHANNRYTCECEGWEEEMIDSIIGDIQSKIDESAGYYDETDWKEQISYMKGLKK